MKRKEWINVDDELPFNHSKVMARFENGEEKELFFWDKEEGFDPYQSPLHMMVTHWQPIIENLKR